MTSTAWPGRRLQHFQSCLNQNLEIKCARSDYEKFAPGLVLGLTGLPLAAHHHSGHQSYHYGLLHRSRSGI